MELLFRKRAKKLERVTTTTCRSGVKGAWCDRTAWDSPFTGLQGPESLQRLVHSRKVPEAYVVVEPAGNQAGPRGIQSQRWDLGRRHTHSAWYRLQGIHEGFKYWTMGVQQMYRDAYRFRAMLHSDFMGVWDLLHWILWHTCSYMSHANHTDIIMHNVTGSYKCCLIHVFERW